MPTYADLFTVLQVGDRKISDVTQILKNTLFGRQNNDIC